jgi:hypothetical protein
MVRLTAIWKQFHANVLLLVGNARIEGMIDDLHMCKNVETSSSNGR